MCGGGLLWYHQDLDCSDINICTVLHIQELYLAAFQTVGMCGAGVLWYHQDLDCSDINIRTVLHI